MKSFTLRQLQQRRDTAAAHIKAKRADILATFPTINPRGRAKITKMAIGSTVARPSLRTNKDWLWDTAKLAAHNYKQMRAEWDAGAWNYLPCGADDAQWERIRSYADTAMLCWRLCQSGSLLDQHEAMAGELHDARLEKHPDLERMETEFYELDEYLNTQIFYGIEYRELPMEIESA